MTEQVQGVPPGLTEEPIQGVPSGLTAEPIQSAQSDQVSGVPPGLTAEPIAKTPPAPPMATGSFQTKPGGPILGPKDIPAPETPFYKKHPANVLYRDIRSKESPEQIAARQQASQQVDQRIQQPVNTNDLMSPEAQQAHPMIAGGVDLATGMLTPANIGIMAATEGLGTLIPAERVVAAKVMSRLVAGAFTAQQVWGVAKESPELWDAIKTGDESKALRLTTHLVGTAAFIALGAQHAGGVEATPSTRLGEVAQDAADKASMRAQQAFRSDARASAVANSIQRSAEAAHDQRLNEHSTNTDQAHQASQDALQTAEDFRNGKPGVTQKNVDDSANRASAATANLGKSAKVLTESHEALSNANNEVDRMNDKIDQSKANADVKASAIQNRKVKESVDAFMKMAPPTKRPGGAYTPREAQIALGATEQMHPDSPSVTVQGHAADLQQASDNIDAEVGKHIEKYGKDPITTNVTNDVRDNLSKSSIVGFADAGADYLASKFNFTTDPSLAEAQKMLTDMNALTRDLQNQGGFRKVQTALRSDPKFAAVYWAADSLRTGIDGALAERGVDGIKEKRADQAAIIRVKTAVEDVKNKGSAVVRGSAESGPIMKVRSVIGKSMGTLGGTGGAVIGGAIGGAFGGVPGGEVGSVTGYNAGKSLGERFGKQISPADRTRDQLAATVHQVSGKGIPIAGITDQGQPAGVYGPPSAVSPVMDMYVPQRENTPLHGMLATRDGKTVGNTSYVDLEQRFLNDMARQDANNVPLASRPAGDQKILAEMNNMEMADKLAAQKQRDDRAKAGKTPATPTLPEHPQPVMDAPASGLAGGMDTENGIVHGLAQAVVGDQRGIAFSDGVRSHLHPENQATEVHQGATMSTPIDMTPFQDEDGNIDPAKLKTKMADIAATYVAGGVANDLYHDVPFTENHHLGGDLRVLKSLFREAGFSPTETTRMIAQATDDARQTLQTPGMQDMLEAHAEVREPDLPTSHHISPERLEQILEDTRGVLNEGSSRKSTADAESGKRTGETPGAGAKVEPKERNSSEFRQKREGPTEGEGGGVRPDEPVEPKPGLKPEPKSDSTDAGNEPSGGLGTPPPEFKPIPRPEGGWPEKAAPQSPVESNAGISASAEAPVNAETEPKPGGLAWARRMLNDEETRPAGPGEPVKDQDEELMQETQSPRKQTHTVQIIDREGNSHREEVPAYSPEAARRDTQNKYRDAEEGVQSVWGTEEKPKDIPAKKPGYIIPKQEPLSVGDPGRGNGFKKPDIKVVRHEDGHAMNALNEGIDVEGMMRHTHPRLKELGGRAAVSIDWEPLKDPATGKLKPEKVPGVIRMLMGGVASDEAFNDIPRDANKNFDHTLQGSDANLAVAHLRDLGIPEGDIQGWLHRYTDQAKAYLTKPEVSGVIKENEGTREPGLSTQWHKSGERYRGMHDEIQRRIQNGQQTPGNDTGNVGVGVPGNKEDVPGGEGGSAQANVPASRIAEPGRAEPQAIADRDTTAPIGSEKPPAQLDQVSRERLDRLLKIAPPAVEGGLRELFKQVPELSFLNTLSKPRG